MFKTASFINLNNELEMSMVCLLSGMQKSSSQFQEGLNYCTVFLHSSLSTPFLSIVSENIKLDINILFTNKK